MVFLPEGRLGFLVLVSAVQEDHAEKMRIIGKKDYLCVIS